MWSRGPGNALSPQRFTVIRRSNPSSPPTNHTPQCSMQQGPVPGSPEHHYQTLPHNQKRPTTVEGTTPAYASPRLYAVPLQRTMSLPATTPRPPAPTHSPPPPPISASLTAIMNHIMRLENIQSSSASRSELDEGRELPHVTGRRRLQTRGDCDHHEWNDLFTCSSGKEEGEEDYERV
ncbi:hypothetical protein ACOMHN_050763 [Nucella lapillus]